jgi:hypothetical protein
MIGDMPPEEKAEPLRDDAERELGVPIPTRIQV